jgi:hypothetical protein
MAANDTISADEFYSDEEITAMCTEQEQAQFDHERLCAEREAAEAECEEDECVYDPMSSYREPSGG